jgi:TonB-linked SusC/RagA family outer membrane protein
MSKTLFDGMKNARIEKQINILMLCVLFLITGTVAIDAHKDYSQETPEWQQAKIRITGTVVDRTGEPVIGANIMEKGVATNGTVTDADGEFALDVSQGATLVVSYIGYVMQEIVAGNRTNLQITLIEDTQALEEVVVVGYGTQKKINLTGSVASISGEAITKRPVINAVSMLQGLLPGVRVVQNNGQPGGNFTMQVHGYGTFSGAGVNPMVLIDGVEGDMASLDPNTIQSVSVLKDAASAAIYGSRAANGVILVTTKDGSGSPDGKLKVAYHYNYGIHSPIEMLDLVTNSVDYMTAWNTRIRNSNYGIDQPARQYPQEEIEKYRNATDRIQYPNFDWVDFIINPAPTQMHNLSVSGGKQTRYNFSLGYFDEKGTMEAFWYKRYNGQLNIVSDVSKRLKVGVSVNLKKGVKGEESSGQENYFLCVLAQPPTFMPTLPDGSGRYSWRAYPFEECNWNPYLMLKERPTTTDDYDVKAQAWSDFEIIDGLHWYLKGATNYRTSQFTAFSGTTFYEQIYRYPHGDGYQHTTGLTKRNNHTLYTNLYSYLDYNKRFGVHQVGAMFGYSNEENNYNEMSAYRREYSSPLTPELNAGAADGQTNSGTSNAWAMQSVFGRLNYSFRDRYLLEADVRYDGTSRLSPEKRWGVFPSFSAAWRISEERFMESTRNWLSNLKIRGSWGQLGNQNIGLYPYQAMLSFTGVYPFDNSTLSQGVAQTGLNNYNIRWETTTTTGLGLDVTLYNRLSLTLDVYRKLTTDILRGAQVNALVGLSAPTINNGSVQNTGYDLDIKYQNRVQSGILEGLTYDIGANFSGFKNKLVKFGTWEDGGSVMREEGRPWNTFYLLQVEGIFQSAEEVANSPKQYGENTQPGMLKFKDVNKDDKIDNNDRVPMEEGVFPDCMYGFTLNGAWKGFDLYGFFQGVAGSKVYVTGWGIQPFQQGSAPTKDQFKNSWTPENHSTKYVMLGDPVSYNHPSTYLLKDNSYFRLKTLQFGYSLPGNIIGKVGLSRLRVYFAGDNLLTFTKYEGLDPERGGNGRYVSYPQSKVISFGCNIEF